MESKDYFEKVMQGKHQQKYTVDLYYNNMGQLVSGVRKG